MDVSVIIPTYNHEEFIRDAIESALNQSYDPLEIIITDDHSTDATPDILKSYKDQYPDLISINVNKENLGVAKNFNIGIQKADGEAVTFLPGDDKFLPEKLEYEVRVMRNSPDANVVFSNYYFIDIDGDRVGKWAQKSPPSGDVFKESFMRTFADGKLLKFPLIDIDTLYKVGLYDESLPHWEDWDRNIRLSKETKFYYTDELAAEHRLSNRTWLENYESEYEVHKYIYEKNKELLQDLDYIDKIRIQNKVKADILSWEFRKQLKNGDFHSILTAAKIICLRPHYIKKYKNVLDLLR